MRFLIYVKFDITNAAYPNCSTDFLPVTDYEGYKGIKEKKKPNLNDSNIIPLPGQPCRAILDYPGQHACTNVRSESTLIT